MNTFLFEINFLSQKIMYKQITIKFIAELHFLCRMHFHEKWAEIQNKDYSPFTVIDMID